MSEEGVTVKIGATPSEQAVKLRTSEATVTLPDGKVVKLKRPGALAQYRLIEMLGPSASNETYVGMVQPLIYIESIDGERVHASTKPQIEALINRLEEDGINALMEALKQHFGKTDPKADAESLKA